MESEGMLMPLLLPFPGHSLGLGLLLLSPQPETGKRESKLILTEWRRDQPPRHLCGPQFLSWVLQRRQLWGRGIVGHPGLSGRDPPQSCGVHGALVHPARATPSLERELQ